MEAIWGTCSSTLIIRSAEYNKPRIRRPKHNSHNPMIFSQKKESLKTHNSRRCHQDFTKNDFNLFGVVVPPKPSA
uniref:Uncharacterized protein n=1 Tax=Zymomonas mobilis subsp. mobilis str. CP4 = NRRL B-14023 TaxID=627343 RepID=B3GN86_ZYMMB|nr:hypothetical protein [Zymomonas mobilis subsp. mobilis str. CP4 = NRRL B-14023]